MCKKIIAVQEREKDFLDGTFTSIMKIYKETENILYWSQRAIASRNRKPITTESKILAAGNTIIEFACSLSD